MSPHVGTLVVGNFPPEKEDSENELGGQHLSSVMDPNFPVEQVKPWCMPILTYPSSPLHFMLANILCTYV
jgi:hypothetical protein